MRLILIAVGAFALIGCKDSATSSRAVPPMPDRPAFPERQPVVAAPVQTIPYEVGYEAGYPLGLEAAKPRDKVPPEADIAPLAMDAAGSDPDRGDKWRSGWTAGYLDGFRKKATGAK